MPSTSSELDISVVIPAFNEERRLPPTLLDMIDFFDARGDRYELIVVDDGSTDTTAAVVAKVAKLRPQVRLIRLVQNSGKGAAVQTGVAAALGARILMADADGATPIQELIRLETGIASGAEVAIGSRALQHAATRIKTVFYRKYLGRIFNFVVNQLLLPDITDTQCGFKLFRRNSGQFLFSQLTSKRFGFDVELLYLCRQLEFSVIEVPINWTNIPGSKVNLLTDSAQMFLDVLRFRFKHRGVSTESYSAFLATRRSGV